MMCNNLNQQFHMVKNELDFFKILKVASETPKRITVFARLELVLKLQELFSTHSRKKNMCFYF